MTSRTAYRLFFTVRKIAWVKSRVTWVMSSVVFNTGLNWWLLGVVWKVWVDRWWRWRGVLAGCCWRRGGNFGGLEGREDRLLWWCLILNDYNDYWQRYNEFSKRLCWMWTTTKKGFLTLFLTVRKLLRQWKRFRTLWRIKCERNQAKDRIIGWVIKDKRKLLVGVMGDNGEAWTGSRLTTGCSNKCCLLRLRQWRRGSAHCVGQWSEGLEDSRNSVRTSCDFRVTRISYSNRFIELFLNISDI